MNTDLEMRITARNRTAAAFADVRGELARTGTSMTAVEASVSRIGGVVGALPGVFAAAFAGVSIEAFARAITDATHNVAELGRQARATNVSFEGFQELGYAAERNQIAIADLGNGLREMQDKASEFAKSGGGRAAEALQTLGFDAKSTAAALKAPDQMFESIIDRLGQLDHASQIRFLGDIFGNAEGDKFLRLLDEGKAGIESLRDEARRDGLVIGDEMEAAAERTDAAFDKLWRQLEVKFKTFAVTVSTWLTEQGNWQPGGKAVPGTFGFGHSGDTSTVPGSWGFAPVTGGTTFPTPFGGRPNAPVGQLPFQTFGTQRSTFDFAGFLDKQDSNSLEGSPWDALMKDAGKAASGLSEAEKQGRMFERMLLDVNDVLNASNDPFAEQQKNLDTLSALLNAGQISWEQYSEAVHRSNLLATSSTLGSIGQITGILAGAFEDNKLFAAANAAVNTAEGITKALAQGGMFAWPTAIAIGAAGAAQIATILSAQPGSAKVASVSGGGAGGGASAAAAAPALPTANIVLQGSRGDIFSYSQVESFVKQLKDMAGDGLNITVGQA